MSGTPTSHDAQTRMNVYSLGSEGLAASRLIPLTVWVMADPSQQTGP